MKYLLLPIVFSILLTSGFVSNEIFADSDLIQPIDSTAFDLEKINHARINAVETQLVNINFDTLKNSDIKILIFNDLYTIQKHYFENPSSDRSIWYGEGEKATVSLTIFENNAMYGKIQTLESDYVIKPNYDENGKVLHHSLYLQRGFDFPHNEPSLGIQTASHHHDQIPTEDFQKIRLLENSYKSDHPYLENIVTIDVFVVFTTAVDETGEDISREIQKALDDMDRANRAGKIPIEMNLLGTEEVRYDEKSTFVLDKESFDPYDDPDNVFNRAHEKAVKQNADIVVLLTTPIDYNQISNPNDEEITEAFNEYEGCGIAGSGQPLSKTVKDSFVVVAFECLEYFTLAHEIGHLLGAGHNRDAGDFENTDNYRNIAFTTGHGYYNVEAEKRTIMSYDCDTDNDLGQGWTFHNSVSNSTCKIWGIWSDPERTFFGSSESAGTEEHEHNAKVIFATAPYIASFRGDEQSYDVEEPKGIFVFPKLIFAPEESMTIEATFDEAIHEDHPPHVTMTNSDDTSMNPYSVTLEMNRDTDIKFTLEHTLDSQQSGEIAFTFSNARDIYGNPVVTVPLSSGSSSITIEEPDTNPPVFNEVSDVTQEATDIFTPVSFEIPTAIDEVEGETLVTCDFVSGELFELGETIVSCSSSDSKSNTSTVQFTVIIQDTTIPEISIPDDITKEATDELTIVSLGESTAFDIFGVTISKDAPESFELGETLVTWTVTDGNGLVNSAIQTITIQDTTIPEITTPDNITQEATGELTTVIFETLLANDIFGVTISKDAPESFELGETLVTWTVTDGNGLTNSVIQTVIIQDTTSPEFDPVENISHVTNIREYGIIDFEIPTASDIVDNEIDVTCNYQSGEQFPIGISTVECTAIDDSGNSNEISFDVSVIFELVCADNEKIYEGECVSKSPNFHVIATLDREDSILEVNEGESFILNFEFDREVFEGSMNCFDLLDENLEEPEIQFDMNFRSNKNLFSYDGITWGGDRPNDRVTDNCKVLDGHEVWIKVPVFTDPMTDEGTEIHYFSVEEKWMNLKFPDSPIQLIINDAPSGGFPDNDE